MHKCDIHKSQKKAIYFVRSLFFWRWQKKTSSTVSKTEALLFIEMEESAWGGRVVLLMCLECVLIEDEIY